MDQTRLLCEFGANPFSGSRDISWFDREYDRSHDVGLTNVIYRLLCMVWFLGVGMILSWRKYQDCEQLDRICQELVDDETGRK